MFSFTSNKMFWISAKMQKKKQKKKNYVSNKNKIAEIKRNFFVYLLI